MSWPSHAHTAADREHAGREGVALTEEELAAALHDMAVEDNSGHADWQDCATTGPCRDEGQRLAARLAAQPVPAPTCECPPCSGRGNDGHGATHCAECCMGTGVEAEVDCPTHGDPRYNQPVPAPSRTEAEVRAEALREAAEQWGGPERVRLDTVARWLCVEADRILRDAQPTEDGAGDE